MGGEKVSGTWLKCRSLGSPPHGQGKDKAVFRGKLQKGITPAWAGKSCWNRSGCGEYGDHPRVGGEKLEQMDMTTLTEGSPPRRRGKVL